MSEVANLMPPDHRIASVRSHEAMPPSGLELVDPEDTIATTKEEEWISKKKTEITNIKQIETRVKRQVVIEDGEVVEDSGPIVTTNTSQDTKTQERAQTELRNLGNDGVDSPESLENVKSEVIAKKTDWVAVPNAEGIVREVKERKIVSREETEEVKETEDVQHLGDITDEDFLTAVNSGNKDLRKVLRTIDDGNQIVSSGPRLINETWRSNKVIDTEDTRELSSIQPDGKIVTETERTTQHEEIKDDELPEGEPEQNFQKESSQRFHKTREQEDVDYIANGANVGHEMRFKTETMEVERRGDRGVDEPDLFESLSARARRRANNRQTKQRGLVNDVGVSLLDRKDALTRKPLDFDQEEETRKVETSKWLENHFGSESRSSNNSTVDEEDQPPKTSFFNVTIKSQPRAERVHDISSSKVRETSRAFSPVEAERDRNHNSAYYKGVSEWSETRKERPLTDRRSPLPYYSSSYSSDHHRRMSPLPDYQPADSPVPDYRSSPSPVPDYRPSHSENALRHQSPDRGYGHRVRDVVDVTPTPPRRTKNDRQRHVVVEDITRDDNDHRNIRIEESRSRKDMKKPIAEPPPDYSPPNTSQLDSNIKKQPQKTRFALDTPAKPPKSGNIIGQSIRKLVGKIRSASAERKARQRAKRSPSPSYQQGHVIDSNIGLIMDRLDRMDRQQAAPVQRYYLGEDPFAGSIYGREHKYEGAKPTSRNSRKQPKAGQEERRSQSTLGRFSKSTTRLVNNHSPAERNSQTLPRHLNKQEPPSRLGKRSNSTINVSIINTLSSSRKIEGPAKPARTYKSNLSRSKSLNVHASNPHLSTNPIGLKSPGLISSLNRSQRDVNEDVHTARFARNGNSDNVENKRVFLSALKDRAPELYNTLDDSNSLTNAKNYGGDIFEPPTRLRDAKHVTSFPNYSLIRRGSSSSTDYSETYHTTTRNEDPRNASVTETTKTFNNKTIPAHRGRGMETVQSSETKTTKSSHYRGRSGSKPVVIEVRDYK